jgi:hypothetical protein
MHRAHIRKGHVKNLSGIALPYWEGQQQYYALYILNNSDVQNFFNEQWDDIEAQTVINLPMDIINFCFTLEKNPSSKSAFCKFYAKKDEFVYSTFSSLSSFGIDTFDVMVADSSTKKTLHLDEETFRRLFTGSHDKNP